MQLGAASSSSWPAAGAVGEESAPLWRLLRQRIPAGLGRGPPRCVWAAWHGGELAKLSLQLCSFFLLQSELSKALLEKKKEIEKE